MPIVKVKLLKPLDGKPEGQTAEFERVDADRLVALSAVKIIGSVKEAEAPLNKMSEAPFNKSASTEADVSRAGKAKK